MSRIQPSLSLETNQEQSCISSRSKLSSQSRPIKLLEYHAERSQSKTKKFISQMLEQSFRKSGSTCSSTQIKEMHEKLQFAITELIGKLEEKRNYFLKNCDESQLREAGKMMATIKDMLQKGEVPKLTISTAITPKYSNESFSCNLSGLQTTRSRGNTLTSMMNHFKAFDKDTPKTDFKSFELKTPKNQEATAVQESSGKIPSATQFPLTPGAKTRVPLLRVPSKLSENYLKPPAKVTFSPHQQQ